MTVLSILNRKEDGQIHGVSVGNLFSDVKREREDLERYLDATRSTLFFAKAVMLVEGMAEALLLPVMASKCLSNPIDLDEMGLSIVPVYGLAFRPFLRLFGPEALLRKCAVLLDSDDKKYLLKPEDVSLSNVAKGIVNDFQGGKNPFVEPFTNLKTFEYDLAVATRKAADSANPDAPLDNESYILEALRKTPGITKKCIPEVGAIKHRDMFGKTVLELIETGRAKGRFAQTLAGVIDKNFVVPPYIQKAFDFLMGVNHGNG